jgi:hypothetical protein
MTVPEISSSARQASASDGRGPRLVCGRPVGSATLGGDSPQVYLLVIRLVFVAMSLGTALGIYSVARAWRASENAAAADFELTAAEIAAIDQVYKRGARRELPMN